MTDLLGNIIVMSQL